MADEYDHTTDLRAKSEYMINKLLFVLGSVFVIIGLFLMIITAFESEHLLDSLLIIGCGVIMIGLDVAISLLINIKFQTEAKNLESADRESFT